MPSRDDRGAANERRLALQFRIKFVGNSWFPDRLNSNSLGGSQSVTQTPAASPKCNLFHALICVCVRSGVPRLPLATQAIAQFSTTRHKLLATLRASKSANKLAASALCKYPASSSSVFSGQAHQLPMVAMRQPRVCVWQNLEPQMLRLVNLKRVGANRMVRKSRAVSNKTWEITFRQGLTQCNKVRASQITCQLCVA